MSRNSDGVYTLPAGIASAPYLSDVQIQVGLQDLGAEIGGSPRASQMTDLGGIATTTGSGAVYALALNTPWANLPTGLPFVFRAHAANPGASTLSLNGKAPIPLRSATGQDLPAGTLVKGALFLACLNLASFSASGFGDMTTGSNQVTNFSALTGVVAGQAFSSAAPGVPVGTTILSISGSTLTLSAAYNGVSTTGAACSVNGPEILLVSALSGAPPVAAGLGATGANAATALQLTALVNELTSVPGGTGVVLPALAGRTVHVMNATDQAVNVYPVPGGTINQLATKAPFVLGARTRQLFLIVTASKAYT